MQKRGTGINGGNGSRPWDLGEDQNVLSDLKGEIYAQIVWGSIFGENEISKNDHCFNFCIVQYPFIPKNASYS
jgi:hypothetical protein